MTILIDESQLPRDSKKLYLITKAFPQLKGLCALDMKEMEEHIERLDEERDTSWDSMTSSYKRVVELES